MARDDMSSDFKRKIWKYGLIIAVLLILTVLVIAFIRSQSKTMIENNSLNPENVREKTIFDDIKIKINSDIFSYDQLNNEVVEQDIISYFEKNLKKGDTIIYVSHDIGVQQLLMAKIISHTGRIYIFNPFEKYNDSIKLSAKVNGFENRIVTQAVAVSDKSCFGMLTFKNRDSSDNGIIQPEGYVLEDGHKGLRVRVSTLDELCANLQNIDFLRISTANEALKVLKGGRGLISRSPNVKIIVDYTPGKGISFDDFKNIGFDVSLINDKGETISDLSKVVSKVHILLTPTSAKVPDEVK